MKKKLLLGIIIIAGLGVLGWVAMYGSLRVEVTDGTANSYHYQILDAAGKKVIDKDSGDSISVRVKRGTYQVLVTNNNTSYVTATKTSGFLNTTHLSAKLQAEVSRRFVGSNPGSCMYFTDRLISGACGGSLSDLKAHIPATAAQPSYTDDLPLGSYNTSSTTTQVVQTPNGLLGLTAQSQESGSGPAGYYLYSLQPDFSVTSVRALGELSISDTYFALPYKEGLFLYDNAMHAWYLSSATASLQQLKIDGSKESDMKLAIVTTANNAITAVYTDQSTGADTEGASSAALRGNSEVVVFKDGTSHHFSFNTVIVTAQACGTDKLCAVSSTGLAVYDISSARAKLLYTLSGVTDLADIQGHVLAVTDQGVVTYDADSQEGYFSYSFGKYQYCGLHTAPNGYLLCVIDPKGQRQALYNNLNTKDSASMDKKVLGLFGVTGISNVSLYDNFIFITPNYGEGTYDWATHTQTYDPSKKAAVDSAIAQATAKSGLNTAPYQVINIGQQ